jgi:hypothetical protein
MEGRSVLAVDDSRDVRAVTWALLEEELGVLVSPMLDTDSGCTPGWRPPLRLF